MNDGIMHVELARKYLTYTDRMGETAFAVIMVIIINGYVALSELDTSFLYIVTVDIVACLGWGTIDGFIYVVSSAIDRNNRRNQISFFKLLKNKESGISEVKKALRNTLVDHLDEKGKDIIARDLIENVSTVHLGSRKIVTRAEILGGLSILIIYLLVGFLLAIPYLILPNKIMGWLVSNLIGLIWLFWYGIQLGKIIGRHKLLLGFSVSMIGFIFLILSYLVWALGAIR
jgi:hypothetical protein